MPVRLDNNNSFTASAMVAAMHSDDPEVQASAWQQFHESVCARMHQDFEDYRQSNDESILAARGYRQLTSTERTWYNGLIEALRSDVPTQTFAEILGSDIENDLMPETILEDVYKNLRDDHPLLDAINFTYAKYATKWILNNHTSQKAVWGKITDAITKEIQSGFKVVSINQSKLSAFAFIENGMLDLGPTFLDAYVRAVLSEAMLCGFEYGFIKGTGVDEPIGMMRDIHEGVSISSTDGYPLKKAIAVTSFSPQEYGELLANLVKTEDGHNRKFSKVFLICNMNDYLTKVMPASTLLTTQGIYINGLFPFPTDVIISNELDDGQAIIGLLGEYNAFVGGSANGTIEFSDEFKFLDDVRYFKVRQYGTGRAYDNTSFLLADISDLEPTYVTVAALTASEAETTDLVV